MKNKKSLAIVPLLLIVLVLAGGAFYFLKTRDTSVAEQSKKKSKVIEPKNIIALNDRPYVQLIPSADGHYIDLVVNEVPKAASEVEYELEYQSGSLLQGLQDILKLDKLPARSNKLFGSKSAGGAVTYHTDIKGGSLQLRFLGKENYVLKQDWRYFDNKEKFTELSSKDGKFQLTSTDLKTLSKIVVYNTPGVPKDLKGELASDAYSLTASSAIKGKGNITLRANEEATSLKLMAYDGKAWQEVKAKVDGKTVMAEGAELKELYVVVK